MKKTATTPTIQIKKNESMVKFEMAKIEKLHSHE